MFALLCCTEIVLVLDRTVIGIGIGIGLGHIDEFGADGVHVVDDVDDVGDVDVC